MNTAPPKKARELGDVRRLVIKVGSALIASQGRLQAAPIRDLVADVAQLHAHGYEPILVVSGAVAAGFAQLGLERMPTDVVERQAAASVGQPHLLAVFARCFAVHHIHVAQLLMSAEDIECRRRFLSARHTLQRLLEHRIVPIINENDALSDDEIKVGDNDHLAALVTSVASAQLLVMLSRVDGVLADCGRGGVISRIESGTEIDAHVDAQRSESGVGGMIAKVAAARLASENGVPTVIAGGRLQGALQRIVAGEDIGTMFVSGDCTRNSRKRWIAVRSRSRGAVRVDGGARLAILERHASLLPSGVVGVDGDFDMGSRIEIQDETGAAFAVGLVSYASRDVRRMQGRHAKEFERVLGFRYVREVIHRNDLVLLGSRTKGSTDASSTASSGERQGRLQAPRPPGHSHEESLSPGPGGTDSHSAAGHP